MGEKEIMLFVEMLRQMIQAQAKVIEGQQKLIDNIQSRLLKLDYLVLNRTGVLLAMLDFSDEQIKKFYRVSDELTEQNLKEASE